MSMHPQQPNIGQPVGGMGAAALPYSVPCRKCRYDLRGLPPTGNCPECGTPVQFSLQSDALANSDPSWLKSLHGGTVMILSGIAVIIVGGLGAGILVAATADDIDAAQAMQVVGLAVGLIGWLLMWLGTWQMTKEDPSGLGEDRYGTARKVIRITLMLGVVQQVVSVVSALAGRGAPGDPLNIIAAVLGLASIVGFFAFFTYLGKLAMRVPDAALAGRAKLIMWGVSIGYGMIIIGTIAAVALSGGGTRTGRGVIAGACFPGLGALAVLIFGIMAILFLDKYRRMLKWAAGEAERNWQSRGTAGRM